MEHFNVESYADVRITTNLIILAEICICLRDSGPKLTRSLNSINAEFNDILALQNLKF